MMAQAFGGHVTAYYPSFTDNPLASIHYIIGVEPGAHLEPDEEKLEAAIAEVARSWESKLEAALRDNPTTEPRAAALMSRYAAGFPPGYRDMHSADEAVIDAGIMEGVGPDHPIAVHVHRRDGDAPMTIRLKLYRWTDAAALSNVLPILDNMGLKALVEEGFPIRRAGADPDLVWAHEFTLNPAEGVVFAAADSVFEQAFMAVWNGQTEDDGFNRLVVQLGVPWREAALMRALCRYRQQSGLDPGQAVQQAALTEHTDAAKLLIELFHTRFDPDRADDVATRVAKSDSLSREIVEALQAVESLDADRVLRRLTALTQAIRAPTTISRGRMAGPRPTSASSSPRACSRTCPLPSPS